MSFVKEMLDREKARDEVLNNLNVKRIVLRAGEHLSKEQTLNLRGTKALKITQYKVPSKEFGTTIIEDADLNDLISYDSVIVNTWSAVVRNALDMLRDSIKYVNSSLNTADVFIETFNKSLQDICNEMNFKLNGNCPKRLYKEAEEDDLINSKVYKSNKNHLLQVITDETGIEWYMCAVYTQEIVVMLEALLDTVVDMAAEFTPYQENIAEFPQTIFVIEYMERENTVEEDEEVITETVEDIDEELQRLNMAKDLLLLQSKVSKLSTALLEIYADINDIQEKYNLPTADEILKNK